MIVASAENTSSITITAVSSGALVTVAQVTTGPTIEVNPVGTASIPAAFEQRVTDLEDWKNNGTVDGGIIM